MQHEWKFIYLQIKNKILHIETSLWGSVLPDFITKLFTASSTIENYHLLFHKAALFNKKSASKEGNDFDFLNFFWEHEQLNYHPKFPRGPQQKLDFAAILARQQRMVEASGLITSAPYIVESPPNGFNRLVVGLGNESVYENSMTLHHIYGIPYLPGSAIKGMTRNYIINSCFARDDKNGKQWTEKAEQDTLFKYIFGTGVDEEGKGIRGNVVFFDAFPTEAPTIEPDVMNNHFQSYYEGDTPPADWISPNPVFFLTLKDAKFKIYLGVRDDKIVKETEAGGESPLRRVPPIRPASSDTIFHEQDRVVDLIAAWVKAALANHGIGAKTAVGYGRLKETT